MRFAKVLGFAAASAMLCSVAMAGGPECAKAAKSCDKSKATCASDASCEAKLGKCMPKMAMMVGDKSFECPMSAGEAAKKEGKSITYRVSGKDYDTKEKAMAAYADVMDKFAAKFASVQTTEECKTACEGQGSCSGEKKAGCCSGDKSAKTTKTESAAKTSDKTMFCVAGMCFDSKDKAEAASKKAMEAMKTVKVAYRVGSKDFCCDKMAGEQAKKDHAKIIYVVGEETIECPITARITTAKAKVMAAMKALEAGQQKA